METKIIRINPRELKLLKINARFMRAEEYQRLVENVKRDGKLTSVPFCAYDDNWEWEVLSGNHRVQAAIDAGLEEIDVMVTEQDLTKDQRIAIQLSHNSINGQDDMAILKDLYEAIGDPSFKAYSGLDDETVKLLEDIKTQSISNAGLAYQVLNIAFLPSEVKQVKEVLEEVKKQVGKNETLVARYKDYDNYMDTMTDVGKGNNIRNTATVFLVMLQLVNKHIAEIKDMWFDDAKPRDYVPISSVIGRRDMLSDEARLLNKAIDKVVSTGEVKKDEREKALVILAEKYLGVEKKPKK